MIIFVGLVVLAMAINWDALPPKRLIAIPLEPITLVLLYFFIKRIITRKVFDAMTIGLIVMAIGSSIIALIQVVDPMFLRTGPPRIAFGGLWRAYGPFSSEYILGGFQIVALFMLLTYAKSNPLKLILAPLIVLSVVLTFHRLDLTILFVCGVIFFSKYASKNAGARR